MISAANDVYISCLINIQNEGCRARSVCDVVYFRKPWVLLVSIIIHEREREREYRYFTLEFEIIFNFDYTFFSLSISKFISVKKL